jgi:hypothetical protein
MERRVVRHRPTVSARSSATSTVSDTWVAWNNASALGQACQPVCPDRGGTVMIAR